MGKQKVTSARKRKHRSKSVTTDVSQAEVMWNDIIGGEEVKFYSDLPSKQLVMRRYATIKLSKNLPKNAPVYGIATMMFDEGTVIK